MKKFFLGMSVLCVGLLLWSSHATALDLGTNITIYDTVVDGAASTWYNRGSTPGEDDEVEPNTVTGQDWDLEGFYLNGTTLYIVGGWDFINGRVDPGRPAETYETGHVFFDMDGDAVYGTSAGGSGTGTTTNLFGYEYALNLDFTSQVSANVYNYQLYQLETGSELALAQYAANDESNPYRLNPDDENSWTGTFTYHTGLSDAEVDNLSGTTHNAVQLVLPANLQGFRIAHLTQECGNDNLMGAVPEPTTMLLLGTGLVGLAGFGRKKLFR